MSNFCETSRKNQIITKLKQEILEQQQKEAEYSELFTETQLLETRLSSLTLEKVLYISDKISKKILKKTGKRRVFAKGENLAKSTNDLRVKKLSGFPAKRIALFAARVSGIRRGEFLSKSNE